MLEFKKAEIFRQYCISTIILAYLLFFIWNEVNMRSWLKDKSIDWEFYVPSLRADFQGIREGDKWDTSLTYLATLKE